MPDQDRIAILLSRRIAGELSSAEAEELRLAIEQDPMLQTLVAAIDGVSAAPPDGVTAREERQMMERGLRQLKMREAGLRVVSRATGEAGTMTDENALAAEGDALAGEMPGSGGRKVMIRRTMAAAAILLAAVGFYLYKGKTPPRSTAPVAFHEVTAKYGTRGYLELPDGSKLWLNAGSKVRYADGFANGKRELVLQGEAYFDVKHDPNAPFVIHVGKLDVEVLGTTLNVRSYPGDTIVEATLIQGKARIEMPNQSSASIDLRPGEKITMHNGLAADNGGMPEPAAGKEIASRGDAVLPDYQRHNVAVDPIYKTIVETSWVEDKLVFRKERFREVAKKLERWYNIRFHFDNDKYLDDELTGYFKDQPIKNVMDALQLSLGFHYELAGDSILIR